MKASFSQIALMAFVFAGIGMMAPPSLVSNAHAMGSQSAPKPKPKRKCVKRQRKDGKNVCIKWRKAGLTDPQIYAIGYELANRGEYKLALEYLELAQNKNDPKINTYIGFAKRKLGDPDGALVHYRKVLAVAPDDTRARSYMGESFLQKGDVAKAREQLAEIEKRCGTSCVEYDKLAKAIVKHEENKG